MEKSAHLDKILVISSTSDLVDIVREAVDDAFEVLHSTDHVEGLERARKDIPSMIVLGYIEPRGTAFMLHNRLREGWITKYTPLLMVDTGSDPSRRVLSMDEGLQIEADEYIYLDYGEGKSPAARLAGPIARLKERMNLRLHERENTVREAILNPHTFCITWEQVAGRGAFEIQQEEIIENARRAAKGGKIHAISVTDNPGGNPAISTEILCTEIKKLGIEPLVHLAFRDKNRNVCESMLYGLAALGVRNLLLLTGDYPSSSGFKGRAKPVFDMDSVHGLQLVQMVNAGMEHEQMGRTKTLAPTDFFPGASISPFKQTESELMGQYYKLKKKIEAGAQFIIPQLGYDARKMHELLLWLKVNGYTVPVLANIYMLPLGAAKLMNANGIPGAVVTDKLVDEIQREVQSEDKGRGARLMRAAKQYALAKGMGYAGAHIGGHGLTYEMIEYIIEKGEELSVNWKDFVPEFDYPQENSFYFFKKDEKTGLNTDIPSLRKAKASHPLIYGIANLAHVTLFNPESVLFKVLRPVAGFLDSRHALKLIFSSMEHLSKVALFECQNCGDCGLFDVAYLCPMSQCPKNQRNGPCGGSYQGWCEVYPGEKQCIWVRAYDRLKGHHKESSIGDEIVPPCNWELSGTSSWLNFYLGRDHTARRLKIPIPGNKVTGNKK